MSDSDSDPDSPAQASADRDTADLVPSAAEALDTNAIEGAAPAAVSAAAEAAAVRAFVDAVPNPTRRRDADLAALEAIIADSYRVLTSDTYGHLAHESTGESPA